MYVLDYMTTFGIIMFIYGVFFDIILVPWTILSILAIIALIIYELFSLNDVNFSEALIYRDPEMSVY
jgi:hypothetical protein